MSNSPYVPFYTSDFLAGTSGMTSATKGVYITLLCLMYEAEGPITQKWDTLARRCGSTLPAFKRAVSDLQDDGKLEETGDTLWSSKCEKHITQRRERSDSAKAASKKRWEKSEQKQQGVDAEALPAHCQPEPEPYIREGDTNVSLSEAPPAIDDTFQAIQHFNAIAAAANWPTVQKVTSPRRSALRGRIRDIGGLDNWCEAITRASRSSHLTGNNNRGWTADFDWLAKPANFTKLMEGNYDDRTDRNSSTAGTNKFGAGGMAGRPANKSKSRMAAFIAGASGAS